MELTEILKELKEFRMEMAGNFEMIKIEMNDLRQHTDELKLRMNAAELRIAENEDREAAVTQVLIHSLHVQKQLEAKCQDLEGSDRRNDGRIYAMPERSEGNNIVEFVHSFVL